MCEPCLAQWSAAFLLLLLLLHVFSYCCRRAAGSQESRRYDQGKKGMYAGLFSFDGVEFPLSGLSEQGRQMEKKKDPD